MTSLFLKLNSTIPSRRSQVPDGTALFMAAYTITGVPLFGVALSQFAGVFIDRYVQRKEEEAMKTLITKDEFDGVVALLAIAAEEADATEAAKALASQLKGTNASCAKYAADWAERSGEAKEEVVAIKSATHAQHMRCDTKNKINTI